MNEVEAAIKRIENSDASGIDHSEIYGYSIDKELVILGRAYLAERDARKDEAEQRAMPVDRESAMAIPGAIYSGVDTVVFRSDDLTVGIQFRCGDFRDGVEVYCHREETDDAVDLLCDPTRGEVLDLLAALKIETEGK